MFRFISHEPTCPVLSAGGYEKTCTCRAVVLGEYVTEKESREDFPTIGTDVVVETDDNMWFGRNYSDQWNSP